MEDVRLFWVVDSPDENEEIFATKDQATKYAEKFGKQAPYRIYIAEVRNYYFDEQAGGWNYDDQADTFSPVITVVMQNDTRLTCKALCGNSFNSEKELREHYCFTAK